jgi:hypothetical protein
LISGVALSEIIKSLEARLYAPLFFSNSLIGWLAIFGRRALTRVLNTLVGIAAPQMDPKLRRKAQVTVEVATSFSSRGAWMAGSVAVTIIPRPAAINI